MAKIGGCGKVQKDVLNGSTLFDIQNNPFALVNVIKNIFLSCGLSFL
jgi:hypothetical protein